jgi:hypothetical protein
MKQKQKQTQIVNIYNTAGSRTLQRSAKPVARKRVYKKTVDKKDVQQQRMPVYYTQPQYTQYLPAPTITMPTRLPQAFERSSVLPTMTADTKLPTSTGLSTGLKSTQETAINKDDEKALIDYFLRNTPYKNDPLFNFNFGIEKLSPPNPIKPPQPKFKDQADEDDIVYINPPEEEKEDIYNPPTLISDVVANVEGTENIESLPSINAIREMAKGYTKRPLNKAAAKEVILSMDIGYTSKHLDKLNASELNFLIPYIQSKIKDINRGEGQKARGRPRKKN